MKKSPLAQVKEQFGSKEKLVDALIKLPASVIERSADEGEDKDAFRNRLLVASNTKLLRLLSVGKKVSERWGSKDKLVDAILDLRRASKDKDYRSKLSTLSIGKLFDQVSSLENAAKRAAHQAQAKPAKKSA